MHLSAFVKELTCKSWAWKQRGVGRGADQRGACAEAAGAARYKPLHRAVTANPAGLVWDFDRRRYVGYVGKLGERQYSK